MMRGITLTQRKTSGFPLSIGTGLAMESIFSATRPVYDESRAIPEKINIDQYETFWINLTTLIRNLYAALDKAELALVKAQDVYSTLLEEIDVINHLVASEGNEVRVKYYFSTYTELERKVKNQSVKLISLRKPTTPAQIVQHEIQKSILDEIYKQGDNVVKMTGTLVPDRGDKSLVLTHQPYDLTGYKNFESLALIESNTGILKTRSQWSSKYYPLPGKSTGVDGMGRLPFHRKLLLVFGDKSLIVPTLLPIRKHIYQVAEERHWTSSTTMDKVDLDLNISFKDPAMSASWKVF